MYDFLRIQSCLPSSNELINASIMNLFQPGGDICLTVYYDLEVEQDFLRISEFGPDEVLHELD